MCVLMVEGRKRAGEDNVPGQSGGWAGVGGLVSRVVKPVQIKQLHLLIATYGSRGSASLQRLCITLMRVRLVREDGPLHVGLELHGRALARPGGTHQPCLGWRGEHRHHVIRRLCIVAKIGRRLTGPLVYAHPYF